jgi:hypothetical protein
MENEEQLAHVVDNFIKNDSNARAVQLQVLHLQREMRELVDGHGWAAYLSIEEAANERWSELALVLVRWAFNEGARAGRQT